MTIHNHNVSQDVSQRMVRDYTRFNLDANILAKIKNASFINATPRYLLYNESVTSFAANQIATRWINGRLGIQIERSRTNDFLYTQQLNMGNWIKSDCTINKNTVTAPDGSLTGNTVVESTDGAPKGHYFYQGVNVTINETRLIHHFIKAAGRPRIWFYLGTVGFPFTPEVKFDLDAGIAYGAANLVDYGIHPIGNDWYKCWASATTDATAANNFEFPLLDAAGNYNYQGDGRDALYLWQPDNQVGKYNDSTVLSEAVPGTRAVDQLSWAAGDFDSQLVNNEFRMDWIPHYKSHFLPDGGEILNLFDIRSASNRITLRYVRTSRILELVLSAGANPTTDALTFDWQQRMIIKFNPFVGSIRVEGATSGGIPAVTTPWHALYDSGMTYTHGALYDWTGRHADSILTLPYN